MELHKSFTSLHGLARQVAVQTHWWIQGGAAGAHPPTGSISFIFTCVFAEKCMHRRSGPPQWVGAPKWEILDPPLKPVTVNDRFYCTVLSPIVAVSLIGYPDLFFSLITKIGYQQDINRTQNM